VTINKDNAGWVGCKKVLYCDKERDICFVEMKQPSPGIELGDLVPKIKLNCAKTEKQSGMLIGNSYSFGIQASAGPINEEVNGKIKHHIPTIGGASGSPVMNEKGEVMGINFGHVGKEDFVSLNDESHYNSATSMFWIRNQITNAIQQTTYNVVNNKFTGVKAEDLKKIDKALRQNPSCKSWSLP
jgi:S1-C subfamily serine protease